MAEATFDDLVAWLSEREGKSVHVQVGTPDPDAGIEADTVPIVINVVIGGVEPASETDKDRLMVLVRLPDLSRSRFYFDPATVSRIDHHLDVMRVWFYDRFYIGLVS